LAAEDSAVISNRLLSSVIKKKKGGSVMRKYLCAFAFVILVGGLFGSSAFADDTLVRFKGGVGVIPVSNVIVDTTTDPIAVTAVNRNVVRGVNPAGQIWVIRDLKADVKVDGRIKVDGRGLLLGGGNNIGSNSSASVFATLICGTALHSSAPAGVALAPNGDFRIDDVLDILPPNPCVNPVLLIRNAANLGWFAAGIPKLD
jgi:hypothetical protein